MKLVDCLVKTDVVTAEMSIRVALQECVNRNVPGIPIMADGGKIVGRFSIRNAFLVASIPNDLIHGAHLLGHELEHLDIPHHRVSEVLAMPIGEIALEEVVSVSINAQVITALALMEKFNTGYLFAVDNGDYEGVITRQGIASLLLNAPGDIL